MKRVPAVRETGNDYSIDGVTLSDYLPQSFTAYHTRERETLHQTDPGEGSQEYQVADDQDDVDKVILEYQIDLDGDETHVEEYDKLDEETNIEVDVEDEDNQDDDTDVEEETTNNQRDFYEDTHQTDLNGGDTSENDEKEDISDDGNDEEEDDLPRGVPGEECNRDCTVPSLSAKRCQFSLVAEMLLSDRPGNESRIIVNYSRSLVNYLLGG